MINGLNGLEKLLEVGARRQLATAVAVQAAIIKQAVDCQVPRKEGKAVPSVHVPLIFNSFQNPVDDVPRRSRPFHSIVYEWAADPTWRLQGKQLGVHSL
jgi:hypothetical protein